MSATDLNKGKLIRDRLAEVIDPSEIIVLGPRFPATLLVRKLHEEIVELSESLFLDVNEYADVLEVLQALARQRGVSWSDVERAKADKLRERGGFERGVFLKSAPE